MREAVQGASVALEVLHFPLVFFRGGFGFECSQISPLARLRIFLA